MIPSRPVTPSSSDIKSDLQKYVNKATLFIHAPENTPNIVKMLSGDNPVQKVASASVFVMQMVDKNSRESGIEVQDTVKVFGAHEIVNLIAELGETARKIPKLDQKLGELTLSVAVQDYVKSEVAAGRINPQKLKVAMDADIRKLPPKTRKEIQDAHIRIQQTSRQYNNGKGLQPTNV